MNGSEAAEAYYTSEDPFAVLQGKTSCHTGWLKSAGMLLPMGFLISEGYAPVVGQQMTLNHLGRQSILSLVKMRAYQILERHIRLMESPSLFVGWTGDVAFVKDSSVVTYCGSDDPSMNEEWCLPLRDYIHLPSYGQVPSHPVMFNPETLSTDKQALILEALLSLNEEEYTEDGVIGDAIVTGCANLVENTVDEDRASSQCGDSILSTFLTQVA